jgi:hypothetical protein
VNEERYAGIDPGPSGWAWVVLSGSEKILAAGTETSRPPVFSHCSIWIERIVPQGRSVGQETFDTAVSIGRIVEANRSMPKSSLQLVRRRSVVSELLGGNPGSTDAHLKKRLVELIGPMGTPKKPSGPLAALAPLGSHGVAALACAYYGLLGRGRRGHDWWKFNYETGRCE